MSYSKSGIKVRCTTSSRRCRCTSHQDPQLSVSRTKNWKSWDTNLIFNQNDGTKAWLMCSAFRQVRPEKFSPGTLLQCMQIWFFISYCINDPDFTAGLYGGCIKQCITMEEIWYKKEGGSAKKVPGASLVYWRTLEIQMKLLCSTFVHFVPT